MEKKFYDYLEEAKSYVVNEVAITNSGKNFELKDLGKENLKWIAQFVKQSAGKEFKIKLHNPNRDMSIAKIGDALEKAGITRTFGIKNSSDGKFFTINFSKQ
jgi:hypothetical protein